MSFVVIEVVFTFSALTVTWLLSDIVSDEESKENLRSFLKYDELFFSYYFQGFLCIVGF